jgi:hypothetical protein
VVSPVCCRRRETRRGRPIYEELGALLGEIVRAQRNQFGHQMLAFVLLAVGIAAPFFANWMTTG